MFEDTFSLDAVLYSSVVGLTVVVLVNSVCFDFRDVENLIVFCVDPQLSWGIPGGPNSNM